MPRARPPRTSRELPGARRASRGDAIRPPGCPTTVHIVAADLAMLVRTLRACASVAEGRTTIAEADLDRAERLGQRILADADLRTSRDLGALVPGEL